LALLTAKLRSEFDEEASQRLIEFGRGAANDPRASLLLMATYKGPFNVPDESFEEPASLGVEQHSDQVPRT
jgi:hypothetical protein